MWKHSRQQWLKIWLLLMESVIVMVHVQNIKANGFALDDFQKM